MVAFTLSSCPLRPLHRVGFPRVRKSAGVSYSHADQVRADVSPLMATLYASPLSLSPGPARSGSKSDHPISATALARFAFWDKGAVSARPRELDACASRGRARSLDYRGAAWCGQAHDAASATEPRARRAMQA